MDSLGILGFCPLVLGFCLLVMKGFCLLKGFLGNRVVLQDLLVDLLVQMDFGLQVLVELPVN